jgi:hypothetical protein
MKKTFFLFFLLFNFALKGQLPGTVVMIPGLLLDPHSMVIIGRELKPCIDVDYFQYDSLKNTIYGHGKRLVYMLQYIVEQKPGEPIYFVTHSIGALILRSAVNQPECPLEAKQGKAVLLAPPNKGSCLARSLGKTDLIRLTLGQKSGGEIMNIRSEDISRCFGEFPPTMRVLVLAGNKGVNTLFGDAPNDKLLTVEETRLNTIHEHKTLHISHGDFLNNRCAISLVKNFLLCGN